MSIDVLKYRIAPLILSVAYDHIIALFVYIKVSYDLIYLELWQLTHPSRRQALSLLLLLEALEVLEHVVNHALAQNTCGVVQGLVHTLLLYCLV